MVARTEKNSVSVTPPAPQPPAPPLGARVEGTLSVTSRLTATGGYEYTMPVHLTERAGVAVTVTKLELAADDGMSRFLGEQTCSEGQPRP